MWLLKTISRVCLCVYLIIFKVYFSISESIIESFPLKLIANVHWVTGSALMCIIRFHSYTHLGSAWHSHFTSEDFNYPPRLQGTKWWAAPEWDIDAPACYSFCIPKIRKRAPLLFPLPDSPSMSAPRLLMKVILVWGLRTITVKYTLYFTSFDFTFQHLYI